MSIAYAIGSGGNGAPGEKRDFRRQRDPLAELFLEYLDIHAKPFDMNRLFRQEKVEALHPTIDDAHGILLDEEARNHPEYEKSAGHFVNRIYEMHDDPVIVYGVESSATLLGADSKRIIINTGSIGKSFGQGNKGVIINLGHAGDMMGSGNTGMVINAGSTDGYMCFKPSDEKAKGIGIHMVDEGYELFYPDHVVLCQKPLNRKTRELIESITLRESYTLLRGRKFIKAYPADGMKDYFMRFLKRENAPSRLMPYLHGLVECARSDPYSMPERFGNAQEIIGTVKDIMGVRP